MKEYKTLLRWIIGHRWYTKRVYYSFIDKLIYTKNSQIFYKRVALVPYEISHTRFYNFVGRTIFSIKEVIALMSHDKIFKKSITLEGYENYNVEELYEEGHHHIQWPSSPFIELNKATVDDRFIKGISDSYHLSYKHDSHLDIDKEYVWEEHVQEFKDYYFDEDGDIIKERLKNFRKEKGSSANILTDHFTVLNQEFGYTKSYLKSLDLILDFHRHSNFINPALLQSISESYAGEIELPVYRGQRLSERILFLATVASQMQKHIVLPDEKRKCIVDIGGGFGHMGRFTHNIFPNSCYILVELNEMIPFGAYFLKYTFPDKKVANLSDIIDRLDDFPSLMKEYDFMVLPTWAIEKLPKESVDLYIATGSLAEMPSEFAQMYIDIVDKTLKYNGYFYTHSRVEIEEHKPYLYIFYKWKLRSKFITLSYNYHPFNLYLRTTPEWIGKKVK